MPQHLQPSPPTWRLSAKAERVLAILAQMPAADRELIEAALKDELRRELRGFWLRTAVRAAASFFPTASNPPAALHGALASARFVPGQPPTDPRGLVLHEVLKLAGAKVLSERHLRRLLAADKLSPEMSAASRYIDPGIEEGAHDRHAQKSRRDDDGRDGRRPRRDRAA